MLTPVKPLVKLTYFSNSSTSIFRRCTYRFYQQYMVRVPFGGQSAGQRVGEAGHLALKAFYSGKSIQTAMDWALEGFAPKDEPSAQQFAELEEVLAQYWKVAAADRWDVVAVEKEVRWGEFMGIFDLIIRQRDSGQMLVVDHKFQKSNRIPYPQTNTQVSFYLLLAAKAGIPASGLLFNVIPTGKGSKYPNRKLVSRSPAYLANFEQELVALAHQIKVFMHVPKPLRNFTSECNWDCPIYNYCLGEMEKKYDRNNSELTDDDSGGLWPLVAGSQLDNRG